MPELPPKQSTGSAVSAGYFDFSDWATIAIEGPDAQDFLNRLSTLNFKHWDTGLIRLGAFLNAKSGVVSLGFFQSVGCGYHYMVPATERETTLSHLEAMHFGEDLKIADQSPDWALWGLWKHTADNWDGSGGVCWHHPLIPELTYVKVPRSRGEKLIERWASAGVAFLPETAYDYYRTRAGVPRPGRELGPEVLVLEAGLEAALDRNKGCYPGQEVVERIFTYGRVNRKLLPVDVHADVGSLPMRFDVGGKIAAILVSAIRWAGQSPVGLAFVYRGFWESGTVFENANIKIQVRSQEA